MDKKEILNQLIENLELPQGKSNDQIWEELQPKLKAHNSAPVIQLKPSIFRRVVPFMAAASVALAVMFFFPSASESTAEFSTSAKEFRLVELADGSEVNLSPNSELSVEFTEEERVAKLSGEAFFEVKKGVPFTVKTAEGVVSVLGTSFNVNSRKDLLDVKCFTGKVKVTTDAGSATLTKGLGVNSMKSDIYNHASILKVSQDGSLVFDQQPLNSVLEDLSHFRGFSIKNMSTENPIISFEILDETIIEISQVLEKITTLSVKVVGENEVELY